MSIEYPGEPSPDLNRLETFPPGAGSPPNPSLPTLPTHLSELLERQNVVIFTFRISPDPAFLSLGAGIQKITGYHPTAFHEKPMLIRDIALPEDRQVVDALFSEAPAIASPVAWRIYRPDGEVAWLEANVLPVTDADADTRIIEGILRDVTLWQHTEESLREAQALLAGVFEASRDAIIILDRDQAITFFSRAAEILFGYSAGQVLGEPLDRLIPVRISEGSRAGKTRMAMAMHAGGGEFPVEVALSTYGSGAGWRSIVVVRVIDEKPREPEDPTINRVHDRLTDLYGEVQFWQAITQLEKEGPYPVSVVVADVDSLAYANEVFGRSRGDDLLKDVARIFKTCFRTNDVIARLGGDEFGVLLPGADSDLAANVIRRIQLRLAAYNRVNRKLPINLSIGVSTAGRGEPLRAAHHQAEQAIQAEKRLKDARRRGLIF